MYFCPSGLFFFPLANRADPDEMLPYAAFHLGIHCLQSTPLPVLRMKRVENVLYNTVYAFSLKGFTYDKILKKKV